MALIFWTRELSSNSKSILSDVKSYHEFCTFFGLNQLIKVPTRIRSSSSTIIDHGFVS